jgi:hypothetical protein
VCDTDDEQAAVSFSMKEPRLALGWLCCGAQEIGICAHSSKGKKGGKAAATGWLVLIGFKLLVEEKEYFSSSPQCHHQQKRVYWL